MTSKIDPREDGTAAEKKLYVKPSLQQYGNIATLTQSINGTMNSDGGGGQGAGMNRTS